MKRFDELELKGEILEALKELGFVETFPIQAEAIPSILKGKDVIGQAHTGTGKTAAFSLPILNRIERNGLQSIILVPTRELALQVTAEIRKFSKYLRIRTVTIYGGQSINVQLEALRHGAEIIVATPGRLIDHMKRGSIELNDVRFVVLDEADKMFEMGFIDDIKIILDRVPHNAQICLFSATMHDPIYEIASEYMKEPEKILIDSDELSLDTIDQSYLLVGDEDKLEYLCDRIKDKNTQTIVFCSTRNRARVLARNLQHRGFRAIAIHGDLPQKKREQVMNSFRKGYHHILVATDLAARGIDVPTVGYVINYDVPDDPFAYFHRIGRTARAGKSGEAFTLVSARDQEAFNRILDKTDVKIRRLNEELGIEIKQYEHDRGSYNKRRYRNGPRQRYTFRRNYYGLKSRW